MSKTDRERQVGWYALLITVMIAGWVLPIHLMFAAEPKKQMAVAVYVATPQYSQYEKVARTRLEEILGDAGFVVLDEAKAAELKSGWVDLADPGHLITAEEFVERANRYDIQKVARVSLSISVQSNLGLFHSATAAAELRFIDSDAKVQAISSRPMGVRGFPPSDGITEAAAIINAVQRAVESAAQDASIPVLTPSTVRQVPLALQPNSLPSGAVALASGGKSSSDPRWLKAAQLYGESFKGEEIACTAISPDQQIGAVGGYTWQIKRIGRSRAYGGRIHFVDTKENKEFQLWTLHELGEREKGENGPSSPFACAFLGSWRYLVAATGNKISCFDVERGTESCRVPISEAPERGSFAILRHQDSMYLQLQTDKKTYTFQVVIASSKK